LKIKDVFSLEAKLYDRIWGRYDYDSDVDFLDALFRDYGCKRIIDIGCGTGGHSLRLSMKGYDVTGLDLSPAMLKIAREKDKAANVRFIQGDMRKLNRLAFGKKFDAAICLGQTFSHLLTNKDVEAFLDGLCIVLKKNGLFIFNARNAKKIREEYLDKLLLDHMIIEEKLQVVMLAYNTRWVKNRDVIVWRPIYLIKEDDRMDMQIREHKLRRFHFQELRRMLAEKGFRIKAAYSGITKEEFREDEHETMWFITVVK